MKHISVKISIKYNIIYIYKVVNSVDMFVCLIITQEPLDRFASNYDWETREDHGNVLTVVLKFEIRWVDHVESKKCWLTAVPWATLGSQASFISNQIKYICLSQAYIT